MEEIVEDEEVVEEDVNIHELKYTDGSNEVVKIFNQKCIICLERDSDYIFCSVVISVFASIVIKIRVILRYKNVIFAEHNFIIFEWRQCMMYYTI